MSDPNIYIDLRKSRGSYTETDPFSPMYVHVRGPGFEHFGAGFGNVCRVRDNLGSKQYCWNTSARILPDGREFPAVENAIAPTYEALKPMILAYLASGTQPPPGLTPTLSPGDGPAPHAPTLGTR